jgi:hypothetical protein
MTPALTYQALLVVQALHLLHHRLAKRHISFAEVASAGLLCVPPGSLPPAVLMVAHAAAILVQLIGSLAIRRLSPEWEIQGGTR